MIPQRCKDLANYELASRATGGTLVYIFAATIVANVALLANIFFIFGALPFEDTRWGSRFFSV